MRVALKIAYDGRAFHGHQRQPDARTTEGECIGALKAAKILRDPVEAFFRSASRTDRGVSAVGNVIAFNSQLEPDAVIGAFNDRARDVWAWAVAEVPNTFHPRHAIERWYRYHCFGDIPLGPLRRAARLFVGEHDFRSFTSDPAGRPLTVDRVDIRRDERAILVDVRARSFRRAMVRRIVAAALMCAQGDIEEDDIRSALRGVRRDFGVAAPEPLFLMDVRYPFSMHSVTKPKVEDEWRRRRDEAEIGLRFLVALREAMGEVPPESGDPAAGADEFLAAGRVRAEK